MIYGQVEKKSACISSQLKRCSSAEVAALIAGVLRQGTEMAVAKNYVGSHSQSEVAFAFCPLLGFELLPRLKASARLRHPLLMVASHQQDRVAATARDHVEVVEYVSSQDTQVGCGRISQH
jgi:TnpA family transposase